VRDSIPGWKCASYAVEADAQAASEYRSARRAPQGDTSSVEGHTAIDAVRDEQA
jgi:hypothetical protein